MTRHPRRSRSRLALYWARLRAIDGQPVAELVDPNDRSLHLPMRMANRLEKGPSPITLKKATDIQE